MVEAHEGESRRLQRESDQLDVEESHPSLQQTARNYCAGVRSTVLTTTRHRLTRLGIDGKACILDMNDLVTWGIH